MDLAEEAIHTILVERLRLRRMRLRMNQEAVAHALGLTRTSIVNMEACRQPVALHYLYQWCELLGVEPAEVLPTCQEVCEFIQGDNRQWLT
jgi:transcriptional regulator with XRE-family HTH domain